MKMKQSYSLLVILMAVFMLYAAPMSVVAQNAKATTITTTAKGESLPQLFKKIEAATQYKFLFTYDDVSKYSYTGKLNLKDIDACMQKLLAGTDLTYTRDGKYINVVKGKPQSKRAGMVRLSGKVVDQNNEPLAGVTVIVTGSTGGYATGIDGFFTIDATGGMPGSLHFSYLGMKTQTYEFNGKKDITNIRIVLEDDTKALKEVVVNGMFERRKESFTGATTTFSGEELKSVGNQNLLKSLKSLDPAFQMNEDVSLGSNPNSMPNIQLRGQTSFNIQGDYDGNANQPLFIVDGFESTIEKVYDLDMNRIQSVTLLKDAAAKAVYGSKAGNGVVVITTIRPKTGEIRISYNGDLNIEAPDLSDYNLMNAQEKYDWEVQHDRFTNWAAMNNTQYADELHKSIYDAIQSGVDTYWLSKPLRTGVGQKHSVSLEGGDSKVRYLLGASYNNIQGVMKGSNRNTFNINATLSYTYKNMVFRNQVDYTANKGNESPYGSFSDYVALNQYYAPYDSDGNVKKILGYETVSSTGFSNPVYNPLYNATLNVKNQSQYQTFTDNFDMDWHINDNWRFTTQFSYSHTNSGNDVFYPGSHTMFVDYDANGMADRKGRYTKTNGQSDNFTLQSGINWNKQFGKNYIFANGTWNMRTSNTASSTVVAEGFGNDQMNDISMASYYMHDSHPTGADNKTREMGFVGALNYSFDERYLVDFSIRETGSSVYGSDNHWGTFWSAGAGWNIHNEKFISKEGLLKLLKLRYSIGYTGTQNFNPYQARAKYQYSSQIYDGRLGATIMALPNTNLKWQKVIDNNIGLDLALGSFLTARVEYYIQNTDNMLTDITLPASTGFETYKENMGEMQNKGYEISLGITPWRNNAKRAWVTLTASAYHNDNKITKIYDIFKKSNDDADALTNSKDPSYTSDYNHAPTAAEMAAWRTTVTRPTTKYYEGCSMTAIWAVRSLGIDPVTGQEMFLDKDGNPTFTYSTDDQVVCGDTSAKLRGNIGISAGWNGWTFGVTASYKLGGDIYNSTLIDRVENITGFSNLDKRVSETWTTPGQTALYKGIEMAQASNRSIDITKPTSRFVMKDNELYVSSLNLGYEFYKAAWLKKVSLERLKLSFYCNELFRLNSTKVERGTSYPFARTFSFSLNATF